MCVCARASSCVVLSSGCGRVDGCVLATDQTQVNIQLCVHAYVSEVSVEQLCTLPRFVPVMYLYFICSNMHFTCNSPATHLCYPPGILALPATRLILNLLVIFY